MEIKELGHLVLYVRNLDGNEIELYIDVTGVDWRRDTRPGRRADPAARSVTARPTGTTAPDLTHRTKEVLYAPAPGRGPRRLPESGAEQR